MTPKSSKHINIDNIFNNLTYGYEFQMSDYASSKEMEAEYEKQGKAEIATAKQQLYDLMLEIIGEDYKITGLEHPETEDFWATRNKLKSEQRQKLKELFNE